jgi:hypothetical protein
LGNPWYSIPGFEKQTPAIAGKHNVHQGFFPNEVRKFGWLKKHKNWRLIPKLLIVEGGAPQLEVSLQIQLTLDSDKSIYLSVCLSIILSCYLSV